MADDRVVVIDMAKDQAGSDIGRAKREGVKGLPLYGGIVQTSNNTAWYNTIQSWRNADLPVATYWWPGWGVPEAEADEAVRRHNQAGASGGIMLDLEGDVPGGVNVEDWATRFLNRADAVVSKVPSFYYSTRSWKGEHGVNLPGRKFVVAAYGDDRVDPDVPNPDPGAVLWQFTQHGRAPGFAGDVDLNVGYRNDVAALFGAAPTKGGLSVADAESIQKSVDAGNRQLKAIVDGWGPTLEGTIARLDTLDRKVDALTKIVNDDLKTDLAHKYEDDQRAAGKKPTG